MVETKQEDSHREETAIIAEGHWDKAFETHEQGLYYFMYMYFIYVSCINSHCVFDTHTYVRHIAIS